MSDLPGRSSPAVQAEALYLINLLLAPGLAFLLLLALFRRHHDSADPLVSEVEKWAAAAGLQRVAYDRFPSGNCHLFCSEGRGE